MQSNFALRQGEVVDVLYPDDPRNVSKKFIEYKVHVQHRDATGWVGIDYNNCFLMSTFGGIADKLRYTFRKSTKQQNQDPANTPSLGSKVIILCINGLQTNAVILGGIRDAQEQVKDTRADGHNFFFEFNGLQMKIDDAGEFTVFMRGKTKADGTLDPSVTAGGSSIAMTKDGNVTVATPGNSQLIRLNNTNNKIEINASQELDLNVSGPSFIKSTGLQVGAGTDAMPRFTTYRNAQANLHSALTSGLRQLAQAISTSTLNPPTAKTTFAAACLAMIQAIQSFEQNAASYQSTKNTND